MTSLSPTLYLSLKILVHLVYVLLCGEVRECVCQVHGEENPDAPAFSSDFLDPNSSTSTF